MEKWWLWGKNRTPLNSEKVAFAYANSQVLRDVSLKLKKGEILAIIGKSGSGKSTFLKLVAGIIGKKHDGNIRIFGFPKLFQRDRIGFVPQEDAFIPDLSLEDNVRIVGLTLGISEKVALENARMLLHQLMIDEPLTKLPGELSGGQRARFNIILSILHDPDIMVMDEPFAGLDYKNRRLLWHFLQAMQAKGKSIVLTSHLLREIQENVSRIVILKDGTIFFRGDLEKLKKKLGISLIYEVKLSRLSKDSYANLRKFCILQDIKILDYYEKYVMFGLADARVQKMLVRQLEKLNVGFDEISLRVPNLDEIFMSP